MRVTTGEVRDSLVYLNKYHAKQFGDVDLLVIGSETAAQFDRWLDGVKAEVWEEGASSAFYEPEIRGLVDYPDNPYRSGIR